MKTLKTQSLLQARITLISHAGTSALRRASFPLDEQVLTGELEKIAAIKWTAPRAQQICSGPELRALQTAEVLGLSASVVTEISDIDYGTWRGREMDEIEASDPAGLAMWLTQLDAVPHGGESLVVLIARVRHWMDNQTNLGHTIAVTSPAVIRAAILYTLNAPPESFWRIEIAPLTVTDLRFNRRFWTVRSTGCSL